MKSTPGHRSPAVVVRASSWLMVCLAICLTLICVASPSPGQDAAHPLQPVDRSSPRAALRTFLEAGDSLGAFVARDYLPSPSLAKFAVLRARAKVTVESLDLSELPPAARLKSGRAAALALYETLNRIELPDFDAIPDVDRSNQTSHDTAMQWAIPNTEIVLARVESGPRAGEFLFTPKTVARATEFLGRVQDLPYARAVPLENLKGVILGGAGGWMIPTRWIQALPEALRVPLAEQALWKWIGLALLLIVFALPLRAVHRTSRRGGEQHIFLHALAQLVLPAYLLLAAPAIAHLSLVQLNFFGAVASAIEMLTTAVAFVVGAWICWRLAPVVAEAIIASPQIPTESVDAHLIRICARLVGLFAGIGVLATGAEKLGVPFYGVVASLGVGGLAIALAAQPTVENLIGGLSLFADKPIRVGDLCKYGDQLGTVEAIGIRSTRIRGLDYTLTTIPNAALSKMPIVNFTMRERMLIRCNIGVRYETDQEQLHQLGVRIREMLLGHPRIHPEPASVSFCEFGPYSLNIEVFAYVMTNDWGEFLKVREDVFLQIMDIVKQSGTGFAFPSQTLYLGRDEDLGTSRSTTAEARVQSWRDEGGLTDPGPAAGPGV